MDKISQTFLLAIAMKEKIKCDQRVVSKDARG